MTFTKREALQIAIIAYMALPPLLTIVCVSLINHFSESIGGSFGYTNFEGGQGFFLVFYLWPLSAIGGFLSGLLIAAMIHAIAAIAARRLS